MTHTGALSSQPASVAVERTADGALVVRVGGDWLLREGVSSAEAVERELGNPPRPQRVTFDASALGAWDTGLLTFLLSLKDPVTAQGIEADRSGLPEGVRQLIALAEAVPEKSDARAEDIEHPLYGAAIALIRCGRERPDGSAWIQLRFPARA